MGFDLLDGVAAIGTGGLSLLGGEGATDAYLSGIPFVGQGFAQQNQQKFNEAQTAKQLDFQRESIERQIGFQSTSNDRAMNFSQSMSNTAHQREVADLKKAGLNPLLSANAGASSPIGAYSSGSSASGAAASSGAISGAGDASNMLKSVFNMERDKNKANISLTNQAAKTQKAQEAVLHNTAKSVSTDVKLKKLQLPGAKVNADFQKKYGKEYINTDKLFNLLQKGSNSAGSLMRMMPSLPTQRLR